MSEIASFEMVARKTLKDKEERSSRSPDDSLSNAVNSRLRSNDLVSKLLAATPPYLYAVPPAPHSFFFSEMLRSFVQAKNDHRVSIQRRPRKKSWLSVRKTLRPTSIFRRELENDSQIRTDKLPVETPKNTKTMADHTMASLLGERAEPVPPPPLPNLWFPPIYRPSPYSIDPMHFFIDLRVSSQIWDQRSCDAESPISSPQPGPSSSTNSKENLKLPTTSEPEMQMLPTGGFSSDKPRRSCSAFEVPKPLTSPPMTSSTNARGTGYVLRNLSRIYEQAKMSSDKDLRELIGLELVVDYVKHEVKPSNGSELQSSNISLEDQSQQSNPQD